MSFSKVRGTQDLLDLRLQNFLINKISKHLSTYNFSQIEVPILEHTNLFVRSLGEETDVVTKEMYVFETAGGESICLRPEATAGTMRAYLENNVEAAPWRAWCHGPMFRHERPQKGRWRQFSQINIEVINAPQIEHDILFIKMLDSFFKDVLLLDEYVIKLNFLGCKEDRERHRKALAAFLETTENICETCKIRKEKNILRIFDCKNETCEAIYRNAPKLTDYLCTGCTQEWNKLQDNLKMLSVNFIHNPLLVRGLDYYNKTVFEFTSLALGAQNSFCGGGRYDLGLELGAKKEIPSVGVGIGLGRLLLLIENNLNKLVLPQDPALHVVIPMTEAQVPLAMMLSDVMLANEICTEVILDIGSMKSMMRKANKIGAAHVLILGEEEQKNGTVAIKNMRTGEDSFIKQSEVVLHFKK